MVTRCFALARLVDGAGLNALSIDFMIKFYLRQRQWYGAVSLLTATSPSLLIPFTVHQMFEGAMKERDSERAKQIFDISRQMAKPVSREARFMLVTQLLAFPQHCSRAEIQGVVHSLFPGEEEWNLDEAEARTLRHLLAKYGWGSPSSLGLQ
jgi:hypothetical protein